MLERLRRILGDEGVRAGNATARWTVHGIRPSVVAFPRTVDEAAAVLALASREGWTVEPAGAGTWLDAGRPAERVDIVLATSRLLVATAHEPADLVATVGGGTALQALQSELARRGQWLPLDPPADAAATVGAVLAQASAGPLREAHGTPRDHVLGLGLVTGDGRILELGGRVVKNVAGYDLVKLVIGSRGTVGLITHAHVRLRSIPARDETLAFTAREAEPLLALLARLRAERLEAAALELVQGVDAVPEAPAGGGWSLLVRLQGGEETVDDAAERARRWGAAESLEARPLGAEAAGLWAHLAALEADATLSVRLADAPSRLGELLAWAGRLSGAGRGAIVVAHAGVGIVRVLGGADEDVECWAAVLSEARTALAERRGTVTVANARGAAVRAGAQDGAADAEAGTAPDRTGAPAALLERLDPFGDPGPALRLMKALKSQFDPAGILSPGRFVV